jgi:hypothetical protein
MYATSEIDASQSAEQELFKEIVAQNKSMVEHNERYCSVTCKQQT